MSKLRLCLRHIAVKIVRFDPIEQEIRRFVGDQTGESRANLGVLESLIGLTDIGQRQNDSWESFTEDQRL